MSAAATDPDTSAVPVRTGRARQVNPRRLGAYYTPADLASVVVGWAMNGRSQRFLDPSFGGCSFLHAAAADISSDSQNRGLSGIYGVDIDRRAVGFASGLIAAGLPQDNLLIRDFFSVRPPDIGGEFDAVVANPPYIRHHQLGSRVRANALKCMDEIGVPLDGRADCWAYFALHAARFVSTGGRLVLLLPPAVLHADYATGVLRHLGERFRTIRIIRLHQRFFAGTEEQTVVVCASNDSERMVRYQEVTDLSSLEKTLGLGALEQRAASVDFDSTGREWKMGAMPANVASAWARVTHHPAVTTLGRVASIRIGIVTGANAFFIRRPSETSEWHQPGFQARWIVRGRVLEGASWAALDIARARRHDAPSKLIVISSGAKLRRPLTRLVEAGERLGFDQRYKCSVRRPWYSCEDTGVPDAFLPYMAARSLAIVENQARSLCTNSIHRVRWTDDTISRRSLVAASWTSIFALGSELFGRSYSGGVLKVEPSEAARLPIPKVTVQDDLLDKIDYLARAGQYSEARALADREVLVRGMGLSTAEAAALSAGSEWLSTMRTRAATR